jgi:hypothetical protein
MRKRLLSASAVLGLVVVLVACGPFSLEFERLLLASCAVLVTK